MNEATVLAAVFPFLYFLHKLLYVPGLKELLLIFYSLFAFVDIYILVFLAHHLLCCYQDNALELREPTTQNLSRSTSVFEFQQNQRREEKGELERS